MVSLETQMGETTVSCGSATDAVTPISASLGVNPLWNDDEDTAESVELAPIPQFGGSSEIARMALMFTLWASVEAYLYEEEQIEPLTVAREEKKHLSVLRESETSIICLLCLLNNEYYTAGKLIDAMIGEFATADQRGNARKRLVNRTLPVIADRYGLLNYYEVGQGNTREYRICRSERLARFAEKHLVTGVRRLMGDNS
jgi:hypothetical protein